MNLELDKFIGQPLDEILKLGEVKFNDQNFYSIKLKADYIFHGEYYSTINISVNETGIIELIYVIFPLIIDKDFYNEMVKIDGYPNNILGIDKLTLESKSNSENEENADGFNQSLSKRSYSTKEVRFEDKPILIVWKKRFYQIDMRFYYKENATQLIFRKSIEGF